MTTYASQQPEAARTAAAVEAFYTRPTARVFHLSTLPMPETLDVLRALCGCGFVVVVEAAS